MVIRVASLSRRFVGGLRHPDSR